MTSVETKNKAIDAITEHVGRHWPTCVAACTVPALLLWWKNSKACTVEVIICLIFNIIFPPIAIAIYFIDDGVNVCTTLLCVCLSPIGCFIGQENKFNMKVMISLVLFVCVILNVTLSFLPLISTVFTVIWVVAIWLCWVWTFRTLPYDREKNKGLVIGEHLNKAEKSDNQ